MRELEAGLGEFLDKVLAENPLKGEYLLPTVADSLIKSGKARIKVITSPDKWCGVTYKEDKEDKEDVKNTLESMKDKGQYPEKLWK